MGNTIPKCMLRQKSETEGNPVLEVHSRGKRGGQLICWICIKKKIKTLEKYERRLNRRDSFIEEEN